MMSAGSHSLKVRSTVESQNCRSEQAWKENSTRTHPATAGFFWARQGLEAVYLQALMGWQDMRIANRYIRATGQQLNDRVNDLMNVDSSIKRNSRRLNNRIYLTQPRRSTTAPGELIKPVTKTRHSLTGLKANRRRTRPLYRPYPKV